MPIVPGDPIARIVAWTRRWSTILPLLAAELIVWLGFGALLPVMPLYFTAHGVDLATLGLDVLVAEAGWSRHAPNPLLLVGLRGPRWI